MITWPTVVWHWLKEKGNDCAGHSGFQLNKTQARMADDSPLLSWLLPFCSPRHEQRENRLRWKNERTETNWTKMVQANGTRGEKVWFREIGEDGASSFAGRMTQGIFVGHPD